MPKRKPTPTPRAVLGLIAASAVALFLIGELVVLTRSESGQLSLARHLGLGDPSRITQLVGKQIHRALDATGVSRDSIRQSVVARGAAPVQWRIGLEPGASLLQVNHAVARTLEARGASVLTGSESWTHDGAPMVHLVVGFPGRPTHELLLVKAQAVVGAEPDAARLALVLYGFGDQIAAADSFFSMPVPFAVALPPGLRGSAEMFRVAHRRKREVVLHLPLEPINYPQINPGPGTLLVTMKPARISGELRRYLDQAEPITAVANHMGSLATQDMTVMKAVYHELRRHHMPFLHVTPAAGAVCKSLAADMGVAYDEPDAVVDGESRAPTVHLLDRRWKALLQQANERGRLIVLLRATPLTRQWLPRALDSRRLGTVSMVPLSALVRTPVAPED